jgi:hypothetical protein
VVLLVIHLFILQSTFQSINVSQRLFSTQQVLAAKQVHSCISYRGRTYAKVAFTIDIQVKYAINYYLYVGGLTQSVSLLLNHPISRVGKTFLTRLIMCALH